MTSQPRLDHLAGPGNVLAKEPADGKEFAGLVAPGLERLNDAENPRNSLYGRFDLAYGAAHALCLAALRYHGFRPSMRNRTEYEGALDVDERLVHDLVVAGRQVAEKISELAPIPPAPG